MNRYRAVRVLAFALATAGLAAACSLNPKEDPTRYYVLSSLADDVGLYESAGLTGASEEQAARSSGRPVEFRIGIGPVTLPAYLERTRMVTRRADNELQFLETARWAEPLQEALLHTMADNVGLILGTSDVVLHPWYATNRPDYSVTLDVMRFERDAEGAATLAARWDIRDAAGEIIVSNEITATQPALDTSIAASVSAQSHLAAALSRQIADAFRRAGS